MFDFWYGHITGMLVLYIAQLAYRWLERRRITKAGTPSASHNNAQTAICPKCGDQAWYLHGRFQHYQCFRLSCCWSGKKPVMR